MSKPERRRALPIALQKVHPIWIIAQRERYQIHNQVELAAFIYQGKAQAYLGQIEPAHKNLLFAAEQSARLGNRVCEAWTRL